MDIQDISKNIDDLMRSQKAVDAFRLKFPNSETYYISADAAKKFANAFAMTDDHTYGIAVGKTIVDDADHLLDLLGDQDEIAIEFRFIPPQPGQPAEDVCRCLRQCQQQD